MNRILWWTNVGSHMWGMNHAGSDVDVYEVVQVPTRDILIGKAKTSFANRVETADNFTSGDGGTVKLDIQTHEIGNVVHQILEGNVNALWGVFSPIVLSVMDDGVLEGFRRAARMNLSKRTYKSLQGLAYHNLSKYVETGKDLSAKRLNIMARTIQMGITLLTYGVIKFEKTAVTTPEEVRGLILQMKMAYELSPLPETPEKPWILEEWLLTLRKQMLDSLRYV